MKRIFVCAISCLMLSGCLEPEAEKTDRKEAQKLADSLEYVKSNKTGICFGVGTTSRLSTNGTVAYNNVMVVVDCKSVGLQ